MNKVHPPKIHPRMMITPELCREWYACWRDAELVALLGKGRRLSKKLLSEVAVTDAQWLLFRLGDREPLVKECWDSFRGCDPLEWYALWCEKYKAMQGSQV